MSRQYCQCPDCAATEIPEATRDEICDVSTALLDTLDHGTLETVRTHAWRIRTTSDALYDIRADIESVELNHEGNEPVCEDLMGEYQICGDKLDRLNDHRQRLTMTP